MDKARMKTMADRVFRDVSGTMAAGLAWVGTESGLFRTLAEHGALTSSALADASGLVERYVDEWAKGMVAAEYLEYDADKQTFSLPEEHAFLLASDGTDHFMGGLFAMGPVLMSVAPQVLQAFREGGGVRFSDYPDGCREAIDLMNRGNYDHRFVDYWLAQLPEVVERLQQGGSALDLGCGSGRVVAALAKAFPTAAISGVDPDTASIAVAQAWLEEAGVSGNTSLINATLDQVATNPKFDLICACDVLHDLPEPGRVLGEVRERLNEGGTFFVVEPRAADDLNDNINPIGTMFYGFSVFHCMTQSLAQDGAGLGTCLGPNRTKALIAEAGFSEVEELDIRSPVNSFFVARA